jgi:aryl-alcohol dehydrogenase-like predicted oxidoreductase
LRSNRLGHTDLTLSEIGLGCQSLGGGLHHGGTRAALDVVAAALDAGITYFDTSDHYGLGRSEELLGRALRSARDAVVIASKAGTYYTRAARVALRARGLARPIGPLLRPFKQQLDRARSARRRADFSLPYLRAAVEGSLRRLRTDRLDLLQLHKPPLEVLRSGELADAVQALGSSGHVRHVGVACESVEDALASLDVPNVASVQVTINLLDLRAADLLLPEAAKRRVGVIARNPRAAGLLTETRGDPSGETYALDREAFAAARRRAAAFGFLESERRTLAQAAIRYVLQLKGVTATVPRALTVRQLAEIVRAASLPELTADEARRIRLAHDGGGEPVRRYPYRPERTGSAA